MIMKTIRIADWIIEVLNEHGNCALPNNLINLYGMKKVEKEISKIAGYAVLIEKRQIDKYDLNLNPNKRKKTEKVPLYIAKRI